MYLGHVGLHTQSQHVFMCSVSYMCVLSIATAPYVSECTALCTCSQTLYVSHAHGCVHTCLCLCTKAVQVEGVRFICL